MVQLIGITGPSGSGKSTITRQLQGPEKTRLSLDYFYKQDEDIEDGNYDHPSAIRFQELVETLRKLKKGQEVEIDRYKKSKGRIIGKKRIKPSSVVLVEGFLLLHNEEVRRELDLVIYLDVSKEEQLRRRRNRFNEDGVDMDEEYFHEKVYPGFKRYIEPTKKHSDHVVNAEGSPEDVLRQVKILINQKTND